MTKALFIGRFVRLGIAMTILGCLVAALLVTRAGQNEYELQLTQRISAVEWQVSQTIFEAQRLEIALQDFGRGEASHDDVILATELLWSRIDVVKVSDVFENSRIKAALQTLANYLSDNEAMIYEDPATLMAELGPLGVFIRDWALELRRAWLDQRAMNRQLIVDAVEATASGGHAIMETVILVSIFGLGIYMATELVFAQRAQRRERQLRNEAMAASKAKSEFVANVSHEVRTPLNAIMGMAQVLRDSPLTKEQAELLSIINSSGKLLLATINDVLDISKIEAGRLSLEEAEFDLRSAITEVANAHIAVARSKGVELSLEFSDQIPLSASGDQLRVQQVFNNLIGNAVKFTEKGRIDVSVKVAQDARGGIQIDFAVVDTGIGIPEGALPEIFMPFRQADTSKTRTYGGTGLGLPIAKDLCRAMGGTLDVTSREGQGSRFFGNLLLGSGQKATNQAPPNDRMASPAPYSTAAKQISGAAPTESEKGGGEPSKNEGEGDKRLLLVDDSTMNRVVISRLLRDQGFTIIEARTGVEAVEAYTSGKFDVILMDVQMPQMDGIEATRAIRALEESHGGNATPIIAVTANVMSHQVDEYLEQGMNEVLPKPVDKGDLTSMLQKYMHDRMSGSRPAA